MFIHLFVFQLIGSPKEVSHLRSHRTVSRTNGTVYESLPSKAISRRFRELMFTGKGIVCQNEKKW